MVISEKFIGDTTHTVKIKIFEFFRILKTWKLGSLGYYNPYQRPYTGGYGYGGYGYNGYGYGRPYRPYRSINYQLLRDYTKWFRLSFFRGFSIGIGI
jgi:hypothetical protein